METHFTFLNYLNYTKKTLLYDQLLITLVQQPTNYQNFCLIFYQKVKVKMIILLKLRRISKCISLMDRASRQAHKNSRTKNIKKDVLEANGYPDTFFDTIIKILTYKLYGT